jgi:hypothetical protein
MHTSLNSFNQPRVRRRRIRLARWWRWVRGKRRRRAYRSRCTLLSRGEAAFHAPLQQAVAGRYFIMCKVRLADVVTCSERNWRRGMGGAISQKHLDFVLCDRQTTRILLAIELDDRSHERADRRKRDAFVNQVMHDAGVPLLRFKAASEYSVESIQRRVMPAIGVGDIQADQ